MEITILGCGPSYGIPTARFGYGACDENNPKNTRTRSSLLLSHKGVNILFDTPPELREQLYKNNVQKLDAVVWTHMHADHTMGIDDVRIYTRQNSRIGEEVNPLPVYIHEKDFPEFKERFSFYLKPFSYLKQSRPPFDVHLIKAGQDFKIKDVSLQPILQEHCSCQTLGFKVDNFAYTTDLIEFVNYPLENLAGLDVWVLDCTTRTLNNKHIYLEKALQWFEIVKPKRMILTHLGAKMDYDTVSAMLPAGVEMAYDGMKITL